MVQKFIKSNKIKKLEQEHIDIRDVRKGDIFYECSEKHGNFELKALHDPKRSVDGWKCRVQNKTHGEVVIIVSDEKVGEQNLFFRYPQVIEENEKGEKGYFIN
jgi:hypothetical protein